MECRSIIFIVVLILGSLFILSCDSSSSDIDITVLEIEISYPSNEMQLSGVVTIIATVSDRRNIGEVVFYVDGDSLAAVSEAPFEAEWDTETEENDIHVLQCKAIDSSGNEALSNTVNVMVKNLLFTANFTNDWLAPEDEEGLLFISDLEGNLLDEASWSGNAVVEFEQSPSMEMIPDMISVTTIYSKPNGDVYLTTNLGIPTGSYWTLKGYPYHKNELDQIEFDFQNVPDHHGYIISSQWNRRYSYLGLPQYPYTFDVYENPADIYFMLNTINSGVQYLWLNNAVTGNYQVDFANLNPTSSKNIDFQESSGSFSKYLYGYTNSVSFYTGNYLIDYDYGHSLVGTTVDVHYPPSYFTDYKTILSLYDSEDSNDSYYQLTYGDIPDLFTKIDADFSFVNVSQDNYQIETIGTYDEIGTRWRIGDYDPYIGWIVYGPPDITQYSLPTLPGLASQYNPNIDNGSFTLNYSFLSDYPQLSSYYEMMDILFNSPDYMFDIVNIDRNRRKYFDDSRSKSDVDINRMENGCDYFYGQSGVEK